MTSCRLIPKVSRFLWLSLCLALVFPLTATGDEADGRASKEVRQLDLSLPTSSIEAHDSSLHQGEILDAEGCVQVALQGSGKVMEAQGKVAQWKARLFEVESNIYPRLQGLAFVAPMFTVEAKDGEDVLNGVRRKWRSLGDWGPYLHLEMMLVQPIYTFGRLSAGEDAARARLAVEEARFLQAQNAVALETRKFYHLHLYAKSLIPLLESAGATLEKVLGKARELFDEATGQVTTADLMKLQMAAIEVDKFLIEARSGAELSLLALKHTMGLSSDAPLKLAHEALPPEGSEPPPLEELLQLAENQRPEIAQITQGLKAAQSLEKAEKLANAPIIAVAGKFSASWTPTREDVNNPYLLDGYNEVYGGVALAIQFDLAPAAASARSKAARAMGAQVAGLSHFAKTGIPAEVKRAHDEERKARELLRLAKKSEVAARKWMTFSGAAYESGMGNTQELLEGFAAHLKARKERMEKLLHVHTARAELLCAVGQSSQDLTQR